MPFVFPVDATLDGQGRLSALIPLLGAASSVPVPPPALDGKWDFELEARSMSTSASLHLGVTAAFEGTSALNSTTLVWNALVGKRAILDSPTEASVIYETFWGVGLRTAITYSTADIDTQTDVAVVAATADLKGSDVQYEIHAIGLGPKELAMVLRTIPPLGRFDLNTFSLLDDARKAVTNALLQSLPSKGDPRKVLYPLQVAVSASPFRDTVTDAAVYHFVMKCIAAGLDLNGTLKYLKEGPYKKMDPAPIPDIFRKVSGGDGAPSKGTIEKARAFFTFGGARSEVS